MLQGFSVTGTRRTQPGQTQNGAKTQDMVMETWFSPELKIELQARVEQPNAGTTTTRLENIVTAEPDRAMFEPPADYTVKTISPSK
jgi:predicted lysophospholipase L1 biosynthesis ABC-type transport system permease subunit